MSALKNKSFVLANLPPRLSSSDFKTDEMIALLIKTHAALAELKGTCRAINNPTILLNIPLLQESVASSEIEGIHTTIETALEEQIKNFADQDFAAKEALNYKSAIDTGFASLDKYSLSTRTILTIHQKLMPIAGGQFRAQQNQIASGAKIIYTPPPAQLVPQLIGNWEQYVHDADDLTDVLIKVAICHYQFEAIHPFSDGNGRTGRILIVLQLVLNQLLELPILYISGYLNKNKNQYYKLLLAVTESQKWLEFIKFIITAMYEQAQITQQVVLKIMAERSALEIELRLEFSSIYSLNLLDHIFSYPVTYATHMSQKLGITYQTASKYLAALERGGILSKKKTGRHIYYYNTRLLNCLKT